jgi:hypothetical protein
MVTPSSAELVLLRREILAIREAAHLKQFAFSTSLDKPQSWVNPIVSDVRAVRFLEGLTTWVMVLASVCLAFVNILALT